MFPSLTAIFRLTRICAPASTRTAVTPAYPKNTDIRKHPTANCPFKTQTTYDNFVWFWSILSITRRTTSNPNPTVSAEKRSGTSLYV